jgi:hypothetical protein
LIERLRKYEALLSQHGVSYEPIAQELRASDHAEDMSELEHDMGVLKASPTSGLDGPDKLAHPNVYLSHMLLLRVWSSYLLFSYLKV